MLLISNETNLESHPRATQITVQIASESFQQKLLREFPTQNTVSFSHAQDLPNILKLRCENKKEP